MRRRKFLQLSLPVSVSAGYLDALALPIETPTTQKALQEETISLSVPQTFRAFIDTLIPADEISQAASAFGVDTIILEFANTNEAYKLLILQGCEWLNAAARYEGNKSGKFAQQPESARIKIIEVAEHTDKNKAGPARFLKTVLRHANSIYYSRPEVWRTLGYSGPPQPNGFIDFDRKPQLD